MRTVLTAICTILLLTAAAFAQPVRYIPLPGIKVHNLDVEWVDCSAAGCVYAPHRTYTDGTRKPFIPFRIRAVWQSTGIYPIDEVVVYRNGVGFEGNIWDDPRAAVPTHLLTIAFTEQQPGAKGEEATASEALVDGDLIWGMDADGQLLVSFTPRNVHSSCGNPMLSAFSFPFPDSDTMDSLSVLPEGDTHPAIRRWWPHYHTGTHPAWPLHRFNSWHPDTHLEDPPPEWGWTRETYVQEWRARCAWGKVRPPACDEDPPPFHPEGCVENSAAWRSLICAGDWMPAPEMTACEKIRTLDFWRLEAKPFQPLSFSPPSIEEGTP